MSVCIQANGFSASAEYDALLTQAPGAAVATFSGYVRDFSDYGAVTSLELEHYPPMAERVLTDLGSRASAQFGLRGWRIVHRFGLMTTDDIIVWVGTVADHRGEAFAACEFIMDTLKTDAPFWKRETGDAGSRWVESRERDLQRRLRWQDDS